MRQEEAFQTLLMVMECDVRCSARHRECRFVKAKSDKMLYSLCAEQHYPIIEVDAMSNMQQMLH